MTRDSIADDDAEDGKSGLSKSPSLRGIHPGPDRYDTRSAFTKIHTKPEIKFPKALRVTLGNHGSNEELPGPG